MAKSIYSATNVVVGQRFITQQGPFVDLYNTIKPPSFLRASPLF